MARMIAARTRGPAPRAGDRHGLRLRHGAAGAARAEVVSFERYRSLAIEAQGRLDEQGIRNAVVLFGDGLCYGGAGALSTASSSMGLRDGAASPCCPIGRGRRVSSASSAGRRLGPRALWPRRRGRASARGPAPFALPLLMSGVSEAAHSLAVCTLTVRLGLHPRRPARVSS